MRYKKPQTGSSLIEVLISLVVVSIGLLGVAGMQATSMRFNHSAHSKMVANTMAIDMADRIRANPTANYSYDSSDSGNQPSATSSCGTTGCTPNQLAQTDLFYWSRPLVSTDATILPGGRAVISAASSTVSIKILWREQHFSNMALSNCGIADRDNDGTDDSDTACYELSFSL